MQDSTKTSSTNIPNEIPSLSSHPYRLMAPGPVQVHQAVLDEIQKPCIHHRTPEFEEIFSSVLQKIKKVFRTDQHVFLLSSTGSGAMEAALTNTLSVEDRILVIESGKFGQRWTKMASNYGVSTDILEVPWGQSVSPEAVRKKLEEKDYKAVLCQACETSTGALHPIREIASFTRDMSNTLLIVDGITAVGATPLPMDEIGIDVLVAGSQKAFMLPTGLSMIALSQKAERLADSAKLPNFYWNLAAERKANANNQTNFSSNVPLIRGLGVALDIMLANGLSQHIKRTNTLATATRAGAQQLGMKIFPETPSPSLSAFLLPEDIQSGRVRNHLEEKYNITIAGGQDELKNRILRIGHMGAISDDDAIATIECLGKSLNDLYPVICPEGRIAAAVEACKEAL